MQTYVHFFEYADQNIFILQTFCRLAFLFQQTCFVFCFFEYADFLQTFFKDLLFYFCRLVVEYADFLQTFCRLVFFYDFWIGLLTCQSPNYGQALSFFQKICENTFWFSEKFSSDNIVQISSVKNLDSISLQEKAVYIFETLARNSKATR